MNIFDVPAEAVARLVAARPTLGELAHVRDVESRAALWIRDRVDHLEDHRAWPLGGALEAMEASEVKAHTCGGVCG